ncbi:hypothetical protein SAMN05877838_2742 [Hoeflea halophila]|uniref:Uncharacterized protein n=1 Tax=Hoeflea halophila TaxID=714899 RepID=A0A286ICI3_9HYPH|nr:hypothetical protein SAMN05877838_2742 [Hoeflea halophila]
MAQPPALGNTNTRRMAEGLPPPELAGLVRRQVDP